MTNGESESTPGNDAPMAVKKTSSQRGFSPIWIVPIVALVIGVFLIYRVVSEQGPTITISFKQASGLEAGKTKIKFKDVVVGEVSAVELNPDLSGVTVTAQMVKEAGKYMREATRFWVVSAQISGGSISGLGTLLSGDYIGIDPAKDGAESKTFVGLERPPVIQSDEAGTHYKLRSDKLGGLNFGSPVYYKQFKAGQVVNFELEDSGQVQLEIFIKQPYDKHVTTHTRFWNASGIDITIGAEGIEIHTESLISIIAGGIAFSTAEGLGLEEPGPISEDHQFRLYASEKSSRQKSYTERHKLLLYFDDSVRGLLRGAPVELRGYRIGKVVDFHFEFDRETSTVKIPVLIEIEPGRINTSGDSTIKNTLDELVAKGLRAQLKTGNLLSGKLLVDLEFEEDALPATMDWTGKYPIFPTRQGGMSAIIDNASGLIADLRKTVKMINAVIASQEFKSSLSNISATLANVKRFTVQLDENLSPQFSAVLTEAEGTLEEVREMLATNSTTRTEINRLLVELGEAARSIRLLADYLEQHPESLIKGKD